MHQMFIEKGRKMTRPPALLLYYCRLAVCLLVRVYSPLKMLFRSLIRVQLSTTLELPVYNVTMHLRPSPNSRKSDSGEHSRVISQLVLLFRMQHFKAASSAANCVNAPPLSETAHERLGFQCSYGASKAAPIGNTRTSHLPH